MSTTKDTITLYFSEGSSDKFYTISVVDEGGSFSVPFVFGRRGATGQTGEKVSGVDYAKAKKAYDQVVHEKMAKGYTPGAGMKPYAGTPKEKEATGIHCQLLNFIDEAEALALIGNPAYVAQEKLDGIRLMLRFDGGRLTSINRKGLERGFPSEVEADAKKIASYSKGDFILDGECVGTTYYVFDVLEFDGKDMRGEYVEARLKWLDSYMSDACGTNKLKSIKVVQTARTQIEKKALWDIVKRANGEGVVFKERAATYKAGRPNAGGTWLKHKFVSTASCIVTGVNAKRSISLGMLDDSDASNIVDVGNCTIPPNKQVPKTDAIVEIRYLYCAAQGSLYQPVYLGVRDDLSVDDCKTSQLKHKPESGVEVDE